MYTVGILGATGNVGRDIISVLEKRNFPIKQIIPIASESSAGKIVSFNHDEYPVVPLSRVDFSKMDILLSSAGSAISAEVLPKAAKAGCVCIDNTSQYRMDKDIPLIVPEVNRHRIKDYKKRNIIANPNCSTAQMVVALKGLHDAFILDRVVVSTYQSVSGAGKKGCDELWNQTKKIYENQKLPPETFTKQIAFNCIPHIDVFMDDGSTKEEWKMVEETKKIFEDDTKVTATCVRVPVFVGHAESINAQFKKPFRSLDQVYDILTKTEGVALHDEREDGFYVTQKDCVRTFPVYVSRVRLDETAENAINMWVVADNSYGKGAALNTVQIAEELIRLWEAS